MLRLTNSTNKDTQQKQQAQQQKPADKQDEKQQKPQAQQEPAPHVQGMGKSPTQMFGQNKKTAEQEQKPQAQPQPAGQKQTAQQQASPDAFASAILDFVGSLQGEARSFFAQQINDRWHSQEKPAEEKPAEEEQPEETPEEKYRRMVRELIAEKSHVDLDDDDDTIVITWPLLPEPHVSSSGKMLHIAPAPGWYDTPYTIDIGHGPQVVSVNMQIGVSNPDYKEPEKKDNARKQNGK